MSRNKDRLGSSTPEPDSLPPQALQQEPESGGFSFVIPTEFVELPSEGAFYPEGHPLHGQTSLEIKQMTAKEEDMLSSRTLLKKGVALDRVIESVILNKAIDPDQMLVGDKNAVIIATRVSGYGSEYTTQVTCPECGTSQSYAFDLNEAVVTNGGQQDTALFTNNQNGTFTTVLPRTKLKVDFRLMTGRDEKQLLNQMENARKKRQHEQAVTMQLRTMVVAVEGNNTPDAINYLIENMPSADSRHLRMAYKIAAPNVELDQQFDCNECDYEQKMEVPLTADFFWPNR